MNDYTLMKCINKTLFRPVNSPEYYYDPVLNGVLNTNKNIYLSLYHIPLAEHTESE